MVYSFNKLNVRETAPLVHIGDLFSQQPLLEEQIFSHIDRRKIKSAWDCQCCGPHSHPIRDCVKCSKTVCRCFSAIHNTFIVLRLNKKSTNNGLQRRNCANKSEDLSWKACQGIIFINYSEKDIVIAGAYYALMLDSLKTEQHEKR